MFPLIGLILGLIIGLLWNIDIPPAYSSYVAVGILAAIDSVVGALAANLKKQFNTKLFVSGFIGNSAIAVLLAALGDQLDLQLSLAAVFAFGNRIFINFSTIRRLLLHKAENKSGNIPVSSDQEDSLPDGRKPRSRF